MTRERNTEQGCAAATVVCAIIGLIIAVHVVRSAMEARAYERVTGTSVSTWDAMFLDLRVVEAGRASREEAQRGE